MLRWTSALLPPVPTLSPSGASARRIARPALRRLRSQGRAQRRVVDGLRSVARQAGPRAPQRRFTMLLGERAALVRSELLEVAALLEMAAAPDPGLIAELHHLLTDGRSSPLYNRDVQVSTLRATLLHARHHLSSPSVSDVANAASGPVESLPVTMTDPVPSAAGTPSTKPHRRSPPFLTKREQWRLALRAMASLGASAMV